MHECPPIPQFCLEFLLRSNFYFKECPPSVSIANGIFPTQWTVVRLTYTTRCKLHSCTTVYTSTCTRCLAHNHVMHYSLIPWLHPAFPPFFPRTIEKLGGDEANALYTMLKATTVYVNLGGLSHIHVIAILISQMSAHPVSEPKVRCTAHGPSFCETMV